MVPEQTTKLAGGVRTPLVVRSETRQRSLDERILARFPALFRAFALAWSRLPPRSRLRRTLTPRIVRQGCEAANRRDFELLLISYHPEFEMRFDKSVGGFLPPDLAGVHHGHEAFLRVWEAAIEVFDLRIEHEVVIDFGDRLLAAGRMTGRGASSGVPVDQPLFQVFTLRGGLVIRQEDFVDRKRALEAAGSRDDSPASGAGSTSAGPIVVSRVGDTRPRDRRTLDESAVLRFPRVNIGLLRALDRINFSPRSRLRRFLVRRRTASGFAAVARGDLELWLAGYSADAVHEWSPGFVSLGFPERATGHRALLEAMSQWDEAWERWTMTQFFIIDLGDSLVLLNRIAGRSVSAGVDVEIDHGVVIDLSRGLATRERDYNDWADALRVGGLDPELLTRLEAMAPGQTLEL